MEEKLDGNVEEVASAPVRCLQIEQNRLHRLRRGEGQRYRRFGARAAAARSGAAWRPGDPGADAEQCLPLVRTAADNVVSTPARAERGRALGFGVKACTRQSSRSPSAVSPISPPRKPPATHDDAARAATAYFQETKCFRS